MGELGILDSQHKSLCVLQVGGRNRKRAGMARSRMEAEDRASDNSKRAQGSGDEFREVVAGNVFDDFAAARGQCAVSKGDSDADDEVPQRAEAETKRAAIIYGEDAANGCAFRPQGIDGKALAVLRQRLLQSSNGAAGFNDDRKVSPGVFKDFVETSGGENEISARRTIAPTKFCCTTTWNDGESRFVGEAKSGGELLLGGGLEDQLRLNTGDCIAGRGGADMVGAEEGVKGVFGLVQHGLQRDDTSQSR